MLSYGAVTTSAGCMVCTEIRKTWRFRIAVTHIQDNNNGTQYLVVSRTILLGCCRCQLLNHHLPKELRREWRRRRAAMFSFSPFGYIWHGQIVEKSNDNRITTNTYVSIGEVLEPRGCAAWDLFGLFEVAHNNYTRANQWLLIPNFVFATSGPGVENTSHYNVQYEMWKSDRATDRKWAASLILLSSPLASRQKPNIFQYSR